MKQLWKWTKEIWNVMEYEIPSPFIHLPSLFFCIHPFVFYAFAVKETFFFKIDCFSITEREKFHRWISLAQIFRAYVCKRGVFAFDPSCVVFAFTFHCTQFFSSSPLNFFVHIFVPSVWKNWKSKIFSFKPHKMLAISTKLRHFRRRCRTTEEKKLI